MANDVPYPKLTYAVYNDVTFLPCRRASNSPTGYAFASYGADGSHLSAFNHKWCSTLPYQSPQIVQEGSVIYGGMLMNHFGHFLMEALSTLWFMQANPDLPIVWHWIDLPVPHTPWAGRLDEIWRLVQLDAQRHRVIRQPVRIEHVILPQSGLLAGGILHPEQALAMSKVEGVDPSFSERVWLSRRGLPRQFGQIQGEDVLEAIVSALGWQIVRPQTLSVERQARLFASAAVVAGFAGSAFHAALLTARPRARLIILRRPGVDYTYYQTVAKAREMKQTFIEAEIEPLGPVNSWTHCRLPNPLDAAKRVIAAGLNEG